MDAPANFAELLAQMDQIREDIAFIRAMRRLTVITADANIVIEFSPTGENAMLDLRALTPTGATPPGQIPDPTGHSGAVLTTDGSTTSWTVL